MYRRHLASFVFPTGGIGHSEGDGKNWIKLEHDEMSNEMDSEKKQKTFFMLTLTILLSASVFAADQNKYPSPDRFENAIKKFESADLVKFPTEDAVLCIGSSSIRLWHQHIRQDLAPLEIIPRGFGGSNMNDLLHYTDRIVLSYKPRAIVVYEGDNDIAQGISPNKVKETFSKFTAKVHKHLPNCRIYFLAIKPSISRWHIWPKMKQANNLIAAKCKKDKRLTFIDTAKPMLDEKGRPKKTIFQKDNLHMNRGGYMIWRDTLKPILEKAELKFARRVGIQSVVKFPDSVSDKTRFLNKDFLLYLPETYAESENLPLMIFLHGMGERGTDLNNVKMHGPPMLIEKGRDFPFIVLSPQCRKDAKGKGWWDTKDLTLLLNFIKQNYNFDQNRIYLTGLSMGGFGTWNWATEQPKTFAAIAPICGGGKPEQAKAIADLPIWVFHGAKDKRVPLEKSQEMVDALKQNGSKVKFTIYPNASHNSWTKTYNNPNLYKWFLRQSKPTE